MDDLFSLLQWQLKNYLRTNIRLIRDYFKCFMKIYVRLLWNNLIYIEMTIQWLWSTFYKINWEFVFLIYSVFNIILLWYCEIFLWDRFKLIVNFQKSLKSVKSFITLKVSWSYSILYIQLIFLKHSFQIDFG